MSFSIEGGSSFPEDNNSNEELESCLVNIEEFRAEFKQRKERAEKRGTWAENLSPSYKVASQYGDINAVAEWMSDKEDGRVSVAEYHFSNPLPAFEPHPVNQLSLYGVDDNDNFLKLNLIENVNRNTGEKLFYLHLMTYEEDRLFFSVSDSGKFNIPKKYAMLMEREFDMFGSVESRGKVRFNVNTLMDMVENKLEIAGEMAIEREFHGYAVDTIDGPVTTDGVLINDEVNGFFDAEYRVFNTKDSDMAGRPALKEEFILTGLPQRSEFYEDVTILRLLVSHLRDEEMLYNLSQKTIRSGKIYLGIDITFKGEELELSQEVFNRLNADFGLFP